MKLTGPMMSIDASGTFASTMTFAKWKGRNYARRTVTPANPDSDGQRTQRAMMRYLAQEWGSAPIVPGPWQDLADTGKYSPFNAYVAFNLNRWTQAQWPVIDPTDINDAALSGNVTVTPTVGVNQVSLIRLGGTLANAVGVAIALDFDPPGITEFDKSQIDWIFPAAGDGTFSGVITGLPAGIYEGQAFAFNAVGGRTAWAGANNFAFTIA